MAVGGDRVTHALDQVLAAQQLADAMFWTVLQKAELKTAHAKFCDGLAASSYGLPWPQARDAKSEAKAG